MKSQPITIDPDWIRGSIQGDRAAMEALYRACLPMLWPVALRYARDESDARDILNTAMLKVFKNLAKYSEGNLVGWMRTIVIHTGIDAVRSRNKYVTDREITPAMEANTPEPMIHTAFAEDDIMRAVRSLPEHLKVVLMLFAIDGFSHQEIADQLGITANNSRWRLNQARQQMKILLSNLALV